MTKYRSFDSRSGTEDGKYRRAHPSEPSSGLAANKSMSPLGSETLIFCPLGWWVLQAVGNEAKELIEHALIGATEQRLQKSPKVEAESSDDVRVDRPTGMITSEPESRYKEATFSRGILRRTKVSPATQKKRSQSINEVACVGLRDAIPGLLFRLISGEQVTCTCGHSIRVVRCTKDAVALLADTIRHA